MNILIKLTCLIGLVVAPILGGHSSGSTDHDEAALYEFVSDDGANKVVVALTELDGDASKQEVEVNMETGENGETVANVSVTTTENGEEVTKEHTFKGTEAEVQAQIDALENINVEVETTGDAKVVKKKIVKVIKEVEEEVNN